MKWTVFAVQALNLLRQVCRVAATVGLLDCPVIHLVVLAAWDDQADVEDPEEDLTLDQAWDGPVLLCVRLLGFIRWICRIRLDGHRLDRRRIRE